MASRSVRPALADTYHRTRCRAGIAAVLVPAGLIALLTVDTAFAAHADKRPANQTQSAAASSNAPSTTAADATKKRSSKKPKKKTAAKKSAAKRAAVKALKELRRERTAARRQLTQLRRYQEQAREVGLPVNRRHERALGTALHRKITLLNDHERELLRDAPPSARRTSADTTSTATTPRSAPGKAVAANGSPGGGDAKGRRAKIVAYARAQLGKPYVWGAEGPRSFDCSGLTMRAWQRAGINITRTTRTQWNAGRHIRRAQLKPGDLVFRSGRGHVMLYAGGGKVIHAPRSGTTVQYGRLPPHSQVDGYVTFLPRGGTQ